jgi:predicted regulator of Ras-like GTPase activity (Roadblock/LC7/MglB family)
MAMITDALPTLLRQEIGEALAVLHRNTPSVIGCVAATVDGRLLGSVVDNEADPNRMAAMASAMVALGETIGREVRVGRSEYVVVKAQQGLFLLQRVPAEKDLLVLGMVARPTATLGMALHELNTAALRVGQALDAWLRTRTPA